MYRAFSALFLVATLSGCATSWVVDSNVKSFATPGTTVPPGATYRFERLPSQQADTARQEGLEAMAAAALDKVGLRRDDTRPQYTAQIGARVTAALSPWADPWLYGPGPWGYGYGGYYGHRWYGGGWYGGGGGMTTGSTSTIYVGELTVDIYTPAPQALIWRGVASKTLDANAKPDKQQKNLAKAVAKLLKNYPPPIKK